MLIPSAPRLKAAIRPRPSPKPPDASIGIFTLSAATALAAYRTLGCRDGGRLDLRSDSDGVPQFLEVNPLAGLHPTHSDLPILAALAGLPYERLIGEILQAAKLRTGVGLTQTRRRRRNPPGPRARPEGDG